jgi:hypothetical protein
MTSTAFVHGDSRAGHGAGGRDQGWTTKAMHARLDTIAGSWGIWRSDDITLSEPRSRNVIDDGRTTSHQPLG